MAIPESINLTIGDQWEFGLPGLGPAGYQWEYKLEQQAQVVAVTLEPVLSEPLPPPGAEPPDSSAAQELLRVRALQKGRAKILLQQRRPWEAGRLPLREQTITIFVS